ncbi:hypothetical protein D3C71_2197870 [compost metagenome]
MCHKANKAATAGASIAVADSARHGCRAKTSAASQAVATVSARLALARAADGTNASI